METAIVTINHPPCLFHQAVSAKKSRCILSVAAEHRSGWSEGEGQGEESVIDNGSFHCRMVSSVGVGKGLARASDLAHTAIWSTLPDSSRKNKPKWET